MLQPDRPQLDVEKINDVTVVAFVDARLIDELHIQRVSKELFRLVDDQGETKLVIDFREVRFMSSAMVAELVRLHRKLGKVQGSLKLCGLFPALRDVLRTSHLDRLFQIYDNVHTAIDSN